MRVFSLLLLLPIALLAQTPDDARATLLKGINHIYINVDTSLAPKITSSERLDINDIVELSLRRADIALRPYVVNAPESNVPLLEVSIKNAQSRGGDSYEINLRVHDYVTIDRNKERTIATIFEMSRETIPSAGDTGALKLKLRDLMADFVSVFSKQNP
jgi:hypothetical protein